MIRLLCWYLQKVLFFVVKHKTFIITNRYKLLSKWRSLVKESPSHYGSHCIYSFKKEKKKCGENQWWWWWCTIIHISRYTCVVRLVGYSDYVQVKQPWQIRRMPNIENVNDEKTNNNLNNNTINNHNYNWDANNKANDYYWCKKEIVLDMCLDYLFVLVQNTMNC